MEEDKVVHRIQHSRQSETIYCLWLFIITPHQARSNEVPSFEVFNHDEVQLGIIITLFSSSKYEYSIFGFISLASTHSKINEFKVIYLLIGNSGLKVTVVHSFPSPLYSSIALIIGKQKTEFEKLSALPAPLCNF